MANFKLCTLKEHSLRKRVRTGAPDTSFCKGFPGQRGWSWSDFGKVAVAPSKLHVRSGSKCDFVAFCCCQSQHQGQIKESSVWKEATVQYKLSLAPQMAPLGAGCPTGYRCSSSFTHLWQRSPDFAGDLPNCHERSRTKIL